MLIKRISILILPLALMVYWGSATARAAVLTGVEPLFISVGSGVDISYLVIDESTLYSTPLVFAYHYTYDSNNPISGYSLLSNVASHSSLISSTTFYSGGLGNALDSLSYQGGTTVTGTNAPDYSVGTYWSYYLSGGLDGGTSPSVSGRWNYAANGMDSRTITPGSWDGWTFASYTDYGSTTFDMTPSVAVDAVPEPQTIPLVLLTLMASLFYAKWSRSKPGPDA